MANNSDAFRLAADLKINVIFLSWAVKAKLHNNDDWIDYGRFNGDVYAAEIARNNVTKSDCGEIGRHKGLKIPRLRAYRFDSDQSHH